MGLDGPKRDLLIQFKRYVDQLTGSSGRHLFSLAALFESAQFDQSEARRISITPALSIGRNAPDSGHQHVGM